MGHEAGLDIPDMWGGVETGKPTEGSHVEGDSALALGIVEDLVHLIQRAHPGVHLTQLVVAESRLVLGIHELAIGIHASEALGWGWVQVLE